MTAPGRGAGGPGRGGGLLFVALLVFVAYLAVSALAGALRLVAGLLLTVVIVAVTARVLGRR